jgi:hypothetical protein
MTTSKSDQQLITETANYLAASTLHAHVDIRVAINAFAPETLNRILGFGLAVHERNTLCIGLKLMGWDELVVNDYLYMSRVEEANIYTDDIAKHSDALKFYDGVARQSGGQYPEERASQITAITRVLWHMHQKDENILVSFKDGGSWKLLPFINYAPLRDLLVHSPHRDAVANIVVERDIMDAGLIITMLESGSRALIEGAL